MTQLDRRRFLTLAGAAAGTGLALPGLARAQGASRTYRIAILTPRANVGDVAGFKDYFANARIPVEYDLRVIANATTDLPGHLADLRRTRPDLIFTVFTPITAGTVGNYESPDPDKHITDIPVVFSSVTNPVASKIVPSLDAPGRPCTGTRHIAPMETQIKTIQSFKPIKKLAIIYNSTESNMEVTANEMRGLQKSLGFEMIDKPLPRSADGKPDATAIPSLIQAAAREGAEFIYLGPDTLVASNNSKVVAAAALELKLPTFCATELPVRNAEILMGLVSRAYNVGRFAGYKASQILVNDKPAQTIPVETLKRFSFIIRIPVAQKLEMYPPMRLLNIAEVVTG